MKRNLLTALILTGLFVGFTGCSLFNKGVTKRAPEVEKVEEPVSDDSLADDSTVNVSRNIEASGDEYLRKQYRLLDGEWTIVKVNGKNVNTEEMPFIIFSAADRKVYGNSGCNVINGRFSISQNKNLSFENIVTTMMSCDNSKLENSINNAISNARTYSFSRIDGMLHLNVYDHRGSKLIKLRKHNMSPVNGVWAVELIGEDSVDDSNVRLVLDTDQKRLHGNSGCNVINGAIVLDPNKKNAIQFQNLISTRKMCKNMKFETKLLVALECVEHFKMNGRNEIVLFDNKMNKMLTLKRIEL